MRCLRGLGTIGALACVLTGAGPAAAALPLGYSNDSVITANRLTPAAFADTLARGGATIARVQVEWPRIQPTEGPIPAGAWASLDQRIAALRREKIRPLLLFLASPRWARDIGGNVTCGPLDYCHAPPDDRFLGAWGGFVAAAAARYPDAIGLEIWNEPNASSFWTTNPDPARFTRLVCAARSAVRGAGVTTPIVSGGLDASHTALGTMPSEVFLARAYDAGLGACADGIGIHPYAAASAPDDPAADFLRELGRIRATMHAHGDRVHRLWITEIGWSTAGRLAVSEALQATYLVRAYRMASAADDITTFVVHTLMDALGLPGTQPHLGVMGSDGSPKPAYTALRDVAAPPTAAPVKRRSRRTPGGRKGAHERPRLSAIPR